MTLQPADLKAILKEGGGVLRGQKAFSGEPLYQVFHADGRAAGYIRESQMAKIPPTKMWVESAEVVEVLKNGGSIRELRKPGVGGTEVIRLLRDAPQSDGKVSEPELRAPRELIREGFGSWLPNFQAIAF
jgi:hypothetical protein